MSGKDFFGRTQKRVSGSTSNARLVGHLQARIKQLEEERDGMVDRANLSDSKSRKDLD